MLKDLKQAFWNAEVIFFNFINHLNLDYIKQPNKHTQEQ